MLQKINSIEFIPSSEQVEQTLDIPLSSKQCIPSWYKKIPPFKEKSAIIDKENIKLKNSNLKMCMPFFDAISGGYMQKTWTDIFIKKEENNTVSFHYANNPEIIRVRSSVNLKINNEEFYDIEFVWIEPWVPKLPSGYSILYTHPFNRLDLPFFSLSAIIDADSYYHTYGGQYPFFIKKNFEGLIPEGTPMYQMLPFKRERWSSFSSVFDKNKNKKNQDKIANNFWFSYKNKFWQKKQYD